MKDEGSFSRVVIGPLPDKINATLQEHRAVQVVVPRHHLHGTKLRKGSNGDTRTRKSKLGLSEDRDENDRNDILSRVGGT